MAIEIKNRWTGEIIKLIDAETLINADLRGADLRGANLSDANLSDADLRGANLRGANLSDADLSDADLRGADLRGADLSDADLRGANLSDADLRGADLSDANLSDADLRGADLRGADLSDANLSDANLSDANLRGANLSDANLRGADLEPIRNDMWVVLLQSIPEIPALKKAITEGRINGSTYEGECACLAGTVANTRGVGHQALGFADASRPIERFFLGIEKGDTPENNQFSKLALEWLEQFEVFISAAGRSIPSHLNREVNPMSEVETNTQEIAPETTEVPQAEAPSDTVESAEGVTPAADSAPAEEKETVAQDSETDGQPA